MLIKRSLQKNYQRNPFCGQNSIWGSYRDWLLNFLLVSTHFFHFCFVLKANLTPDCMDDGGRALTRVVVVVGGEDEAREMFNFIGKCFSHRNYACFFSAWLSAWVPRNQWKKQRIWSCRKAKWKGWHCVARFYFSQRLVNILSGSGPKSLESRMIVRLRESSKECNWPCTSGTCYLHTSWHAPHMHFSSPSGRPASSP